MDTGTASSGMMEARQVCRNRMTTSTTSATASSRVTMTALIDARTNCVGSYTMRYSTEAGKSADSSSMVRRTRSDTSSALAPGDWKIGMATAGLLSSSERRPYSDAASSMRATSPRRVMPPSGDDFRMMSANSASVFSRPCALIDSCSGTSRALGEPPMTPAATCTFCSRIARTASLAVRPRCATFCGSSHTRMA